MRLQEKTLKLDSIMRKLAEGRDPAQLAENAKWLELLALRQSLQKLLPSKYISSFIFNTCYMHPCKKPHIYMYFPSSSKNRRTNYAKFCTRD